VDENQKSAGQESLIKRESQYQSFSTIEDKLPQEEWCNWKRHQIQGESQRPFDCSKDE
jgi:hypothetical protein